MRISRPFLQWWAVGAAAFLFFLGIETWRDVKQTLRVKTAMADIIAVTGDTLPWSCREVGGIEILQPDAYPGVCFYTRNQQPALLPELDRADFTHIQFRMRAAMIDLDDSGRAHDDDHEDKVRNALAVAPTVLIVRAVLIGIGVSLLPLATGFVISRSRENAGAERAKPVAAALVHEIAPFSRKQFLQRWVFASALFVTVLTVYFVPEVRKANEVSQQVITAFVAYQGRMVVACAQARGVADVDYEFNSSKELCLYSDEAFLKYWPAYKDADLEALRLRFYAEHMGVDPEYAETNPTGMIVTAVLLGIGVPLVSLLAGFALRWAVARRNRRNTAQPFASTGL